MKKRRQKCNKVFKEKINGVHMTDFDQELDCSGLSCPMPILKLTKAMKKLDSGKVLKMIGTDPGSKQDVPDWCTRKGHELLDTQVDGGATSFFIKKK